MRLVLDHDDDSSSSKRYELGRVLGRGGMGVVYEARVKGAHGFERKVAFKTLSLAAEGEQQPDAAERTRMVRRFFEEARIVSRLHHGGIVSVLDYGIRDDEPFQVLELIDGVSIATLLRKHTGGMPEDISLHIALEVAHALSYAHRATDDEGRPLAITHRDVKPSNILVSHGGDVKLVDFGIARANNRSIRTTTGVVTGTPTYMAPEQLGGMPVDGRTDVFALGCTLHAMLTGRSPLATVTPVALFSPGEIDIDGGIASDIGEILRRAIRKKPDDRFATAEDFAKALSALVVKRLQTDARSRLASWLRDPSIPSSSPTTTPSAADRSDRSRRITIFVVAMLIVLAVGALGLAGVLKLARKNAATPPPTPAAVTTPTPTPSPSVPTASVEDQVDADAAPLPSASSSSSTTHHASTTGPHPIQDGCLCNPIKASTTTALCHPELPVVAMCRCAGTRGLLVWSECEEPAKVCARYKAMPSTAKDDDVCFGYPVTFRSVDGKTVNSNMRTEPGREVEEGTLSCSRCLNSPVRVYPRKHGASCRGIHGANGQMIDGRIDCY